MPQWLALLERVARLQRDQAHLHVDVDEAGQRARAARRLAGQRVPLARMVRQQHAHAACREFLQGEQGLHHDAGAGLVAAGQEGGQRVEREQVHARCSHAANDDRRRKILAFSRYDQTPRQRVIELNADGTDYLVHGSFQDDEFLRNWEQVKMVLEDAQDKRTRQNMLDEWPPDFAKPSNMTLGRWLRRACTLGLVLEEGTGRRNAPFRCWLPGQEEKWQQDPMYELHRQIEEANRQTREAKSSGKCEKSGKN